MTCAEFQAQAAAYALGMLDPADRAACDRHLRESEHEGCFRALATAHEAAIALTLSLPAVPPSPATWNAIEARTRTVVPLASARPPRRWLATTGWLVAAAALVLLAIVLRDRVELGRQLQASRQHDTQSDRARAVCVAQLEQLKNDAALRRDALALLELSGTKLVALAQQGGSQGVANVIWHAGVKKAYVVGSGLNAPSGKDYELWVIRGNQKLPAGLLHGDAAGGLVAVIDPKLLRDGAPDAIAVTLEATGGGPEPHGPIVLVGKI